MTKQTASKTPKVLAPTLLTKEELRDRIFGHTPKVRTKLLPLFGTEIELHQPILRAVLDVRESEDPKIRASDMIINYACVPGTNERVFDEADREMILNWPFTDEVINIQMAIAELTGVDMEAIEAAERMLIEDPLKEQS